jgi:hypothetical protein
MTTDDPITGPLPRHKLKELADAPYGEAKRQIQVYDPLWGQSEADKARQKKWATDYRDARYLHALFLKSRGLKYAEIGEFLGVKAQRAAQMVRQARWMESPIL